MTSTLQQEAGRKLHFTSARTMRIAQRLYENGHITYMRTDSTALSAQGLQAARTAATELYGANYVTAQPRTYARKAKNSQEAHEAIRPAGERFSTPGQLANSLDAEEFKLYELIWQRTVASQMEDARGTSMKVTVAGVFHLGGDGALPNQLVELELLRIQRICQLTGGGKALTGRADGLVRLLGVLHLAVVAARGGGHILRAVQLRRRGPCSGNTLGGQARGVRTHVRDVPVFVEALRDSHRARRREVQPRTRRLLQRGGHKRRERGALVRLFLNVGHAHFRISEVIG